MPEKNPRPKIENFAHQTLDGKNLGTLLGFVSFLKKNKMNPYYMSRNKWGVRYKGKIICHIGMDEGNHWSDEMTWYISHSHFTREGWFINVYEIYIDNDDLREYILEHIVARSCEDGCWGKKKYPNRDLTIKNLTILGKTFDSVCHCWPFKVNNFDDKKLSLEKELILAVKKIIDDNST